MSRRRVLRFTFAAFSNEKLDAEAQRTLGISISEFKVPYVFARFKRLDGSWTDTHRMLLDTGGNLSVIPFDFAQSLGTVEETEDGRLCKVPHVKWTLWGISPKSECAVSAYVCRNQVRLEDIFGTASKEFEAWIAVTIDKEIRHYIFGMKSCLDKFEILVNAAKNIINIIAEE